MGLQDTEGNMNKQRLPHQHHLDGFNLSKLNWLIKPEDPKSSNRCSDMSLQTTETRPKCSDGQRNVPPLPGEMQGIQKVEI